VYAKLLALLIQHRVLLLSCWRYPNRSLVKAAQTVREHGLCLALALRQRQSLMDALHRIERILAVACRMNPRRTKPNTYQLLLDPTLT
jgi:hypothetical protein